MKKISILPLVFALLISNTLVFGQKSDTTAEKKKLLPYYIETCTDKMTDKSYAFGSKHLLCFFEIISSPTLTGTRFNP